MHALVVANSSLHDKRGVMPEAGNPADYQSGNVVPRPNGYISNTTPVPEA